MSGRSAAGSAILDPIWATALLKARQAGVPPALSRTATEHRLRGDWSAACAAAAVDVRFDIVAVRRRHGPVVADQMWHDLRRFAPDRLRWHLPRSLPAGGPQKDLVLSLAEYPNGSTLAVRTPGPHWAAGERVVLELLDRPPVGRRAAQWRLVDHRYLWDADEYQPKSTGSDEITLAQDAGEFAEAWRSAGVRLSYRRPDAELLRRLPVDLPRLISEKRRLYGDSSVVAIRAGNGRFIVLEPRHHHGSYASGVDAYVIGSDRVAGLPLMPRPAWCRSFDHELLRLGLASAHELYPQLQLVEDQLESQVRCQGTIHRLRRERGRWIAVDHDVRQTEAEAFLDRLGGPAVGCRRALSELDRGHSAETARFDAPDRYRAALAGLPLPTGISWRRPVTVPVMLLHRGRRNTKPLTGGYIPPLHQREGAMAEDDSYPW